MGTTLFLLLGIFMHIASAAQCTGTVGAMASLLSTVPAAQSFCTSKYPLPRQSVTTTVATSTVTTAYTTTTQTVFTSVSTATIYFVTKTVTTTTTNFQPDIKKRATTTTTTPKSTLSTVTSKQNAQASALSSLSSAANAAAASICSCIETPLTTTISTVYTTTLSVRAYVTVYTDKTRTIQGTATVTTTVGPCPTSFPTSILAHNGAQYYIQESTFNKGPKVLDKFAYLEDLEACLDHCEGTTGCKYINFKNNDGYCEVLGGGDVCQEGSEEWISGVKG